jgi:8-oxo-dGTP pyrophosphatase MutT (NUDIX family)
MSSALDLLTIDDFVRIFQEVKTVDGTFASEPDPKFLEAAVLILLVREGERWSLLFTRRTDTVRDHKGQVSFPGGAREKSDISPRETALRETFEEIGIQPSDVTLFGQMRSLKSISSYIITPCVGTLSWPYPIMMAVDEVSRVFCIPLEWLENPENWEYEWIDGLPDGVRRQVLRYHAYDGEDLWGISAYFAQQLIQLLKEHTR